ncbi:MAG: DMT family transporter [Clostridia bacterium]|nr:DMT family transporter [Clostridia bacterium]
MKKNNLLANLMLLAAAIIWGCAFVAQSEGMEVMGPFTYYAARCYLGAVVLLPVIFASDAAKKKIGVYKAPTKASNKRLAIAGLSCGGVMFVAAMFQQIGMAMGTGSGKAGFITAMYMLIVPIIGLFMKKKVRPVVWGCLAVAAFGLYLLCIKDGFDFETSDLVVFGCAIAFAFHIVVIDIFSDVDGIKLSCIQLAVAAVLSTVFMFILEEPTWQQIKDGWLSIAYAGIMSSGVAFTFQVLAQKKTNPTMASLLMSLESVFAVLGGIVIQHVVPTSRETLGCIIMFAAIVVAQIEFPKKKKRAA